MGQRSPSCGCSHSCHGLDRSSRRHPRVGHGKFTAANALAGKGEEHGDGGEVHGVQPKLGLGEHWSDKKERGIAMDMTPRDSSSLLQSVQGAGHAKTEESTVA